MGAVLLSVAPLFFTPSIIMRSRSEAATRAARPLAHVVQHCRVGLCSCFVFRLHGRSIRGLQRDTLGVATYTHGQTGEELAFCRQGNFDCC